LAENIIKASLIGGFVGINTRENEVTKFRCAETDKAIKDAIITGVGFLMITVDALDVDGSMFVNYKKITKEDVLSINTNRKDYEKF